MSLQNLAELDRAQQARLCLDLTSKDALIRQGEDPQSHHGKDPQTPCCKAGPGDVEPTTIFTSRPRLHQSIWSQISIITILQKCLAKKLMKELHPQFSISGKVQPTSASSRASLLSAAHLLHNKAPLCMSRYIEWDPNNAETSTYEHTHVTNTVMLLTSS